jgi:hypothetical protein
MLLKHKRAAKLQQKTGDLPRKRIVFEAGELDTG